MSLAPPNAGNPAYSNSILFGPQHGRWLGYDTLEYKETLTRPRGGCITIRRSTPTHPKVNINSGLGSMRFKAVLQLQQEQIASPGMEATSRQGISPRVMRITFRSDNSLTGYLRGFFNVPNVFGSAGWGRRHQAELYQGADCADVIVAAAREAGARLPYTSVAGLRRHTRWVTDELLMTRDGIYLHQDGLKGEPVKLPFGKLIRPGDLLLINYLNFQGSPRGWDHIAVIDQDSNKQGRFDPQDRVLHMGYLYGLVEEPALTQSPALIRIARFKPSILRAIKRRAARSRQR